MLKRASRLLPSPGLAWLSLPVLTVLLLPEVAAGQGATAVLNADAGPPLPSGTPIAVVAEEFTDLDSRLKEVVEKALVARGYTVQPNASYVLTYDTEMSAQTDSESPAIAGGGTMETEEDVEQTPPWDDGGGELGRDEPEMFDSNIASIPLGGSTNTNQSEYSLSFALGQGGSPAIWQGSLTAVLPNGDPFEIAESMVPVLTGYIGQTARGKRVPIE